MTLQFAVNWILAYGILTGFLLSYLIVKSKCLPKHEVPIGILMVSVSSVIAPYVIARVLTWFQNLY